MMKTAPRKLVLHRETVRILNDRSLRRVHGGGGYTPEDESEPEHFPDTVTTSDSRILECSFGCTVDCSDPCGPTV